MRRFRGDLEVLPPSSVDASPDRVTSGVRDVAVLGAVPVPYVVAL